MFLICRFKYRKNTFKARVLSAVNCWPKVYPKFALKSLSFGDVASTEDFFVTLPFFREEKKPDNLSLLKSIGEICSILEGIQISCKYLKNLS